MSAVVGLDNLQGHGIRVGASGSPVSVLTALVHFAQLSPAVLAAGSGSTACEVWVARCRQDELAIGLVGEESRTSVAAAALKSFAFDGVDAAIAACWKLEAPNGEVEITTRSTARIQGKDSRDGQKREEANDGLGSHDE